MNKRSSPTSASLARPSRTRCTLVSISLRLLFIAMLLVGLTGFTLGAPALAAQVIAWRSLPSQGLNGQVNVLLLDGSDLYVGGFFTALGDGTDISDYVARYDLSEGTWHSLPNQGLSNLEFGGRVGALALDGRDLYIGGSFKSLGDGTDISDNIVRYDISSGTWHSVPNQGLTIGGIDALLLDGSDLYVGAGFYKPGDWTDINYGISRYDIAASTWYSVSNQGIQGNVSALALKGDDLYVGGSFEYLGDWTEVSTNIARYETSSGTWHSLPKGGAGGIVWWGWIYTLTFDGDDLYIGGVFDELRDGTDISDYIVRYDTSSATWHSLPNQGLNGTVYALELDGTDLYVLGGFTTLGDGMDISDGIALYDTSTNKWYSVSNEGLDARVDTLALEGSDLYVGGLFTGLRDGTNISDNIAHGILADAAEQSPAPIPEASTLLMMASGLATFGGYLGLRWRIGGKRS